MSLTSEQALELAKTETEWWKDLPADVVTAFQLSEECLCMDFHSFHQAVEESLGRPVWTHEFARPDLLIAEFKEEREMPTMQEIIDKFPDKARVILGIVKGATE